MQGSSAPPPCSMPTRVPAPLRSLEWTPEPPLIPHSPPHSLCTPAPLSALLFERPPWTRCGAPWPTSNHHPAAPTNFVLLFLASHCSSAPSLRSRGHLLAAAAGVPAAGPPTAVGRPLLLHPARLGLARATAGCGWSRPSPSATPPCCPAGQRCRQSAVPGQPSPTSSAALCSGRRRRTSRSNWKKVRGLSEESVTHMNSALKDLFVWV